MWYYHKNGTNNGPVELSELADLVRSGVITSETMIWEDTNKPCPASEIKVIAPLFQAVPKMNSSSLGKKIAQQVKDRVRESTGIGEMEGFSIKGLFSEVIKKHSETEMEKYFGVGTPYSTPSIEQINSSWPMPWMFVRIGAFSIIGFFVFWYTLLCFPENSNIIPGVIFFGAFAVPFSAVIFFFETNVPKNISMYLTTKIFLMGGIFGLFYALLGFDLVNKIFPTLNSLGASVAGIVEEPAKLIILIFLLKRGQLAGKDYILNGLLFGAAVGAGFAAFETAGYAVTSLLNGTLNSEYGIYAGMSDMYNVLILRGILAPAGHVVWTAMAAGALWHVKGNKEFEYTMLCDLRFVIVAVIGISLHMVWNSSIIPVNYYIQSLIIGTIDWVIIFGLMGIGLRQIRSLQKEKTDQKESTAA